jgi:hypothetical protein
MEEEEEEDTHAGLLALALGSTRGSMLQAHPPTPDAHERSRGHSAAAQRHRGDVTVLQRQQFCAPERMVCVQPRQAKAPKSGSSAGPRKDLRRFWEPNMGAMSAISSGSAASGTASPEQMTTTASPQSTDLNLTQDLIGASAEEIARMLASAGLNPDDFLQEPQIADAIRFAEPIANGDDRAASALIFGTGSGSGGGRGVDASWAEEALEMGLVPKSPDANLSLGEGRDLPEGRLDSEALPTMRLHDAAASASHAAASAAAEAAGTAGVQSMASMRAADADVAAACDPRPARPLPALGWLPIHRPAAVAADDAAAAGTVQAAESSPCPIAFASAEEGSTAAGDASLSDAKFNQRVRDRLLIAVGRLRAIGALQLPASRVGRDSSPSAALQPADVSKLLDALALKWGVVSADDAEVGGGSLGCEMPRPSTVALGAVHVLPFIERLEQQLRPGVASSLPLPLSRVRSVDHALQSALWRPGAGSSLSPSHRTSQLAPRALGIAKPMDVVALLAILSASEPCSAAAHPGALPLPSCA